MPSTTRLFIYSAAVLNIALIYQYLIHTAIFVSFGVGRKVQSLSEFPYSCRRISDSNIQACEDMWLDDASRTLYLACSTSLSRKHWMPNIARFNAEARPLNDRIIAVSIDDPTPGGDYNYRILSHSSFTNVAQEHSLYLVGMTGVSQPTKPSLDLYLINATPSFNSTPPYPLLPNAFVGANSTIEHFSHTPKSNTLTHIRTFSHGQIATPNNVAAHPSGGFYYTNDHGIYKAGFGHKFSPIALTGDVSYCSPTTPTNCEKVAGEFAFPNGLLYSSKHDLLYVPSAVKGDIHVYTIDAVDPTHIELVHTIPVPYPIDNISEDSDGDLYLAVLPKSGQILSKFDDPLNEQKKVASTGMRVRKVGTEGYVYEVEKVIEDGAGEVLPASTTVIHDKKTGRLFLSGVFSHFIAVCEPNKG